MRQNGFGDLLLLTLAERQSSCSHMYMLDCCICKARGSSILLVWAPTGLLMAILSHHRVILLNELMPFQFKAMCLLRWAVFLWRRLLGWSSNSARMLRESSAEECACTIPSSEFRDTPSCHYWHEPPSSVAIFAYARELCKTCFGNTLPLLKLLVGTIQNLVASVRSLLTLLNACQWK